MVDTHLRDGSRFVFELFSKILWRNCIAFLSKEPEEVYFRVLECVTAVLYTVYSIVASPGFRGGGVGRETGFRGSGCTRRIEKGEVTSDSEVARLWRRTCCPHSVTEFRLVS